MWSVLDLLHEGELEHHPVCDGGNSCQPAGPDIIPSSQFTSAPLIQQLCSTCWCWNEKACGAVWGSETSTLARTRRGCSCQKKTTVKSLTSRWSRRLLKQHIQAPEAFMQLWEHRQTIWIYLWTRLCIDRLALPIDQVLNDSWFQLFSSATLSLWNETLSSQKNRRIELKNNALPMISLEFTETFKRSIPVSYGKYEATISWPSTLPGNCTWPWNSPLPT